MTRRRSGSWATLLFLFAGTAWAKPKVVINIAAFKESPVTVDGGRASRRVPAPSAKPGEVLIYAVTYENQGDEVATNAVVADPIPRGTTYLANTATGEGAEISFSNDGGKTFAAPVKLTYDIKLPNGKSETRVATPDAYTHIRWTLAQIPPGAKGVLEFQVKVN